MAGLFHVPHGNLMGPPVALAFLAINFGRAGPSLGGAQNDHRPGGPVTISARSRLLPDAFDLGGRGVESGGHEAVHFVRLVSLDEMRQVAISFEEFLQFVTGYPGEKARVGDLVAVEVKNRQNRPIPGGIEKLVTVPSSGQGT